MIELFVGMVGFLYGDAFCGRIVTAGTNHLILFRFKKKKNNKIYTNYMKIKLLI